MATIRLIDIAQAMWPETKPLEEVNAMCVSNREGARRVLKADLQATADEKWGNEILAQFDSGKNVIEMPNGQGHSFRVEYED